MQHTDLTLSKWKALPLEAQMANIGSEVERAMQWKEKGNDVYANLAALRALELFILTLGTKLAGHRLKEVARAKELWLDYFMGSNRYHQTKKQWQMYFYPFTLVSRQGFEP